jgi:hypothetical protein
MVAFTEACHVPDEERSVRTKLRISSASVFNQVVKLVAAHAVGVLDVALGHDASTRTLPSACKGWNSVRGVVKTFLENTLTLLGAASEAEMQAFVLSKLVPAARYFICPLRRQNGGLCKMLTG